MKNPTKQRRYPQLLTLTVRFSLNPFMSWNHTRKWRHTPTGATQRKQARAIRPARAQPYSSASPVRDAKRGEDFLFIFHVSTVSTRHDFPGPGRVMVVVVLVLQRWPAYHDHEDCSVDGDWVRIDSQRMDRGPLRCAARAACAHLAGRLAAGHEWRMDGWMVGR